MATTKRRGANTHHQATPIILLDRLDFSSASQCRSVTPRDLGCCCGSDASTTRRPYTSSKAAKSRQSGRGDERANAEKTQPPPTAIFSRTRSKCEKGIQSGAVWNSSVLDSSRRCFSRSSGRLWAETPQRVEVCPHPPSREERRPSLNTGRDNDSGRSIHRERGCCSNSLPGSSDVK